VSDDSIPVSEIKELIDGWREYDLSEHAMFDEGQRQCADDLEKLIQEYTHD